MLSIRNVEVHLKNFKLGPLNLTVEKGEYFVILGPSGAGKSMLLEVLAGFRKANGRVVINNEDITLLPPEKRKVGFLTQEPLLFPHMDVKGNILFGAEKEGIERAIEISRLLRIKPLLDRNVNILSGGEKQRVALARALSANPILILLDEPFSWLDPEVKEEIMEEFKMLTRRLSLTVVHVTHDFKEAFFLADRIAIIKDGEIIQIGTPEEIVDRPKNRFVARFIGIPNVYEVIVKDGHLCIGEEKIRVHTPFSKDKNYFYINPYRIEILREGKDGALKGRIENISYRHPLWKVRVEGKVRLILFVQSLEVGGKRLKEGEEVFVRIPWDAVRFME